MEVLSPTRIKCKFMQDMSEGMEWGRPDETIGFIEHKTMRTVATGTAQLQFSILSNPLHPMKWKPSSCPLSTRFLEVLGMINTLIRS